MATSTLGSGTLVLAGTTSGTTTVTATAVAGTTTLTLPAATDTLVGKATTDTLTNKTLTSPTLTGVATFAAGTAAAPAITTTGDTNTGIWFPAADTIAFTEGGVESMRIDASGNLGLGVTPSAWSSASRPALQLPNGAAFFSRSAATALSQNVFYNSIDDSAYIANGFATLYYQTSGQHQWYTAPSNSSGAGATPISFTQAMTLDASGNLGIGTTTPNASYRLDIAGNSGIRVSGGTVGSVAIRSASGYSNFVNFNESTVADRGVIGFGAGSGSMQFRVNGAYDLTTGTRAMDIDSSGNLLVGATSLLSSERLLVQKSNANAYVVAFNNSNNASGDQSIYSRLGTNANNTSSYHFIANIGNTTDKLYIFGNGNVVNSNNSYGTLSDIKLKENIVDTTAKLADVMQLKVRNFNLKTEPNNKQIGFIAQELETIFPALIDNTASPNDKDNVIKSIKTSVLIPILVKAIQEQQALITTLTARITALEGA